MNPYLEFVQHIEAGVARAAQAGTAVLSRPHFFDESAPKVLLFSPHPDDECITGLLPLRLMREAGMQIINVPVTFGSNIERRPARAAELKAACAFLGFQCPENVDASSSSRFQPLEKPDAVEILKTIRPRIVFMPHSRDWNSRHVATHHLVMDALAEMPADFSCKMIETEYWAAMDDPNLMVEGDAMLVADLVAATSLHVGEVARNPYHLLLPAWMQDNVRRGGELVGGQGETAPDFSFATLYRMSEWKDGALQRKVETGRIIGISDNLTELFNGNNNRG